MVSRILNEPLRPRGPRDGAGRPRGLGVGFGIARLGTSVAAKAPDQLAVVLEVEHRQALDRAKDQDLVAPQIGAQQHVLHPCFHDVPRVTISLSQHDLDPAPDRPTMPMQVVDDPSPFGDVVGGEAGELEQIGNRTFAAMHGMPEPCEDSRPGREAHGELPRVLGRVPGMFHDPFKPSIDKESVAMSS